MKIYIFLLSILFSGYLMAQNEWVVPDNEKSNVSINMFDEDFENEGQVIFENSCSSCHGTPTQGDFSMMLPSPGDAASVKFQQQTDGEMFYRIKTGRGAMPKFEDALGQDEIWYLVAYIRSFNEAYVQAKPNLEGIVIPNIHMELSFDENVDKLVVKTFDENNNPMLNVAVKAYVKGSFGNYLLGKDTCNELGITFFDVDANMPGDTLGNLEVLVKASKGYGTAKVSQKLIMVEPVVHTSVIEGRHLWSVSKMAPYWLKITFIVTIAGIWSVIVYIVYGLINLKKQN